MLSFFYAFFGSHNSLYKLSSTFVVFGSASEKCFCYQKSKTLTKRVEPEGASSEAATFACYNFRNTLDSAFRSLFFQMGENREMFHSCFKEDREGVGLLVVSTKQVTTFPQHIAHNSFCTTHS